MNCRFLLILILLSTKTITAQNIIVLGGYVSFNMVDTPNQLYQCKANLLLTQDSALPDSIQILIGGVSRPKWSKLEYTVSCNSVINAVYTSPQFAMDIGDALRGHIKFLGNRFFAGFNSPDSIPYAEYFSHVEQNIIPKFESPKLISNIYYQNPNEDFRASFMIRSKPHNISHFTDSYEASQLGGGIPASLKINKGSGDVLWSKISGTGIYTFGFDIYGEFVDGWDQFDYYYSVIIADSIKSRFSFDPSNLDTAGFITLEATNIDSVRFEFSFIDSLADLVTPSWNSALPDYGGSKPTILFTQSGDSTKVRFSLKMDSTHWAHIPTSFNFLMNSQKAGRKCITRALSFCIAKDVVMGVSEPEQIDLKNYPNPTHDVLHIATQSALHFEIFNSIGSIVQVGVTDGQIDVSKLAKGIYFIQLHDKTLKRGHVKLVID